MTCTVPLFSIGTSVEPASEAVGSSGAALPSTLTTRTVGALSAGQMIGRLGGETATVYGSTTRLGAIENDSNLERVMHFG